MESILAARTIGISQGVHNSVHWAQLRSPGRNLSISKQSMVTMDTRISQIEGKLTSMEANIALSLEAMLKRYLPPEAGISTTTSHSTSPQAKSTGGASDEPP